MDPQSPLPFSPPAERNKEPILKVLQEHFADRRRVLEIGSGTGQHAVHFAASMPQLQWQSSDLEDDLHLIHAWLEEASLPNTPPPLAWNVNEPFPGPGGYDAVFSANTLHIMGWDEVERLFEALPGITTDDAVLVVYGPFNYAGDFTSDSNEQFDQWLRSEDPRRGLREFEAVDALAQAAGFALVQDREMPANNRCIIWKRGLAAT